ARYPPGVSAAAWIDAARAQRRLARSDEREVSAAGRDSGQAAQLRPAPPHRKEERRTDLPRTGALERRQPHRLPLQRKREAWRSVHRPLAGRRPYRQAHQAARQQHYQSELRRAAAPVLTELILE